MGQPLGGRIVGPRYGPEPMLRTVEAVVENDGSLRLLETVELRAGDRALVTILNEVDAETPLLSQPALAEEWSREEEDAAWAHLQ